jgi:Ca-activated chloride channel family protein
MIFAQPYWLLLLALLPVLIFLYGRSAKKRHVSLKVSRFTAMAGYKTWVVYARSWLQWLRWIVMALLILALARPQLLWQEEETDAEAIDMMLVVDVSPSMLSKDFVPDRLSAVKDIAGDFIDHRKYDRIGLTIFAGGAFTQCPLTQDHRILKAFLNNMQVGRLPNGTAIGTGLATAVSHMKDSTTTSKVVILMTDGENNTGNVGPLQAAAIAAALGIHTYVIGIANDGPVESPSSQRMDGSYNFVTRNMQLDTLSLSAVARIGSGKFYRAQNAADLKGIYQSIDQLEKSKITVKKVNRTAELFFWFLNAAISLLALELLLRWGPLRVITV